MVYISSIPSKRMLDIILTDGQKTWRNTNVILQKDSKNIIGKPCDRRGSFKKMTLILWIRKRLLKFLGRDIWKERLENLILTGHIQDKRDSGEKASYLPNKFEKMDGRIGICSDGEKKQNKSYIEIQRKLWRATISYILKKIYQ